MLSAADRARFTVVLVGARNPSNIGAAARAMQDFGFHELRVVNDYAAPFEAAQLEAKSAVAAAHVMQNARRFSSIAEAIADCTLVVATTAIGERDLRQPVHTLQQVAPRMRAALHARTSEVGAPGPDPGTWVGAATSGPANSDAHVALLFGSEKTGLTNEHLSHCSLLTTIPMFAPSVAANDPQPRHLSMNLGQAVAVCLYELTRAGFEDAKPLPVLHEPAATADDRERLTQLLLDVMHATGYTRRFPANSTELLVRQLARQLGASHREAMTWMGIFRQVLWRERTES